MARKKISRKELKRQKQAQKRQIRRRQGWEFQNESKQEDLGAFSSIMGSTEKETVDNMMAALEESEALMDEPEFEEILFSPLKSSEMFVEVAQEMGWSIEQLTKLNEEELEDVHFDIIQKCIPKLLTPENKQEILQALQSCQERFTKKREPKVAQVAVAHFVLSTKEMGDESWQMPLIHGLVGRSIATGFALIESSQDHMELSPYERMLDEVTQGGAIKKVEGLLKRIPGLRHYLEKQADEVWEAGEQAVYVGELNLELFSEEELISVAELIDTLVKPAFEADDKESAVQEAMTVFLKELYDYLAQIFANPARLEAVKKRIGTILQEEAVDPQWMPFVFLLRGHLDEEDAAEYERPFFIKAIMGETRTVLVDDETIVHE